MMTLIEAQTRFPKGSTVQLNAQGRTVYRAALTSPMTVLSYTTVSDLDGAPIPLLCLSYRDEWGRKKRRTVQAALVEVVP